MSELVRGRPELMATYGLVTEQIGDDLVRYEDDLAEALDAFRASPGWQEFLGRVPPVELDLREVRLQTRAVGDWVARFGQHLQLLDTGGRSGVAEVDVARLSGFQKRWFTSLFEPPSVIGEGFLVVDGEVHYRASHEDDFIELLLVDGRLVLRVSRLKKGGRLEVVDEHVLPADAWSLTIRTGAGKDVVSIPPGVADRLELAFDLGSDNNVLGYVNPDASIMSVTGGNGMRVFAGDGNNTIHGTVGDDRISLGGGNNTVSANAGDDVVVTAGSGVNRIKGGAGDDIISTGSGNDYLDGGDGADTVRTVGGDNVLVAGRGDGDVLRGGSGDDVFIAGRGQTHIASGGGSDRAHTDGSPRHTTERVMGGLLQVIRVEVRGEPGSDAIRLERPDGISDTEWEAWVDGVDSDLEMLRHTPSGNEGLTRLDQDLGGGRMPWNRDGRIVVQPVVHRDEEGAASYDVEEFMRKGKVDNDSRATSQLRQPMQVDYDTDPRIPHDVRTGSPTPSAVYLYHELAHTHDFQSGNADGEPYLEVIYDARGEVVARREVTPNYEVNAVGYDQNGDGVISDDETLGDHPAVLTENAIRRDLGLAHRHSYRPNPREVPPGGWIAYEELP